MKPHNASTLVALFGIAMLSAVCRADQTDDCIALQSERWTPQEQWVWVRLCRNENADLAARAGVGKEIDARTLPIESWSEAQVISASFLNDILAQEPYVSASEGKVYFIDGGWLQEPFGLFGAHLHNLVMFSGWRIDKPFSIRFGDADLGVGFSRSWIRDRFEFNAFDGFALWLDQSRFDDVVDLYALHIERAVSMQGSEFEGYVNLGGLEARALHMAEPDSIVRWGPNAQLSLRNAQVHELESSVASWEGLEGKVDMQGFEYNRLSSFARSFEATSGVDSSAEWPVGDLLRWIEMQRDRDVHYVPQPYEQLAAVLRDTGQVQKADQVLYAKHEYWRQHATTGFGDYLWLTIKKVIIGYGYQTWLTVLWLLGVVFAGSLTLKRSAQGRSLGYPQCLLYSIDQALPLVYMNPANEAIAGQHSLRLKYYFQFHQLACLALLAFLGAGLAGAIG